ncbi:DUF6292 family protein [Amycolatopsis sp. VC5-11]|uniref:DUF6292 family protein n=1 Tax=Amycolatopsis sp. VC5-11 TaxID=3120156 RepID=UPI00300871B8
MNHPPHPAPGSAFRHEPYIRAVVDRLDQLGLTVSGLQLLDSPMPHAALRITATRPADPDGPGHADLITVRWRADTGWTLRIKYDTDALPRATVHFGRNPVPEPEDVADWACYGLAEPLLLRTTAPHARHSDTDINAALSRYREDDA